MALTTMDVTNSFNDGSIVNNTENNSIESVKSNLMDPREVGRLLWVYWSPFTFFLGLVGNALVIKIFGFSKSGKITTTSTTSIYFTVMAIADFSFLIFGIVPEWLEACRFIKLKEVHYVMCKLEKFLFYTSGDVAIWIICITTSDRFIAVCFPYTQQTFRKAKYAIVSSVITLLVAIVKNLHVFWTRGPEYNENGDLIKTCGRPEPYKHFEYYIRPWIAFVLVAILPFALLLVFNIFIVRFFIKELRRKRTTGKKHKQDFTQTIIMCLSVSLTFLVLVTPSLILYVGKPYWTKDGPNYIYDVAKAVGNQLSYINHAINFLLYCITARKFRDEAVKILLPEKIRNYCCSFYNENTEDQSQWKKTMGQTSNDGLYKIKSDLSVNENNVHTSSLSLEKSSLKSSQDKIFTVSQQESQPVLKDSNNFLTVCNNNCMSASDNIEQNDTVTTDNVILQIPESAIKY